VLTEVATETQAGPLAFVNIYVVLSFVTLFLLYREYGPNSLGHIPVVGGARFPILSYVGAIRYFKHAKTILREGCNKYRIFRVAQMDQWLL